MIRVVKIGTSNLPQSIDAYLAGELGVRPFVLDFMKLRSDIVEAERSGTLEDASAVSKEWHAVVDPLFWACEDVELPPDPAAVDDGDDERLFPDAGDASPASQFAIGEDEFRKRVAAARPAISAFSSDGPTTIPNV